MDPLKKVLEIKTIDQFTEPELVDEMVQVVEYLNRLLEAACAKHIQCEAQAIEITDSGCHVRKIRIDLRAFRLLIGEAP